MWTWRSLVQQYDTFSQRHVTFPPRLLRHILHILFELTIQNQSVTWPRRTRRIHFHNHWQHRTTSIFIIPPISPPPPLWSSLTVTLWCRLWKKRAQNWKTPFFFSSRNCKSEDRKVMTGRLLELVHKPQGETILSQFLLFSLSSIGDIGASPWSLSPDSVILCHIWS